MNLHGQQFCKKSLENVFNCNKHKNRNTTPVYFNFNTLLVYITNETTLYMQYQWTLLGFLMLNLVYWLFYDRETEQHHQLLSMIVNFSGPVLAQSHGPVAFN